MTKNEKNINSMVLVDAELLSQGLKTAFTGIAMVFDSLGVSGAADEIKAAQESQEAQTAPAAPAASAASQVSHGEEGSEEAEDLPFDPEPEEPEESEEPDKPAKPAKPDKPADDEAIPAPSVTIDDITKVIVAKIKKKRDNNARIGALLKSYGVEKVSGLPSEKYEAFLTDISEL